MDPNDLILPIALKGLSFGFILGFTFGFIGRAITKSEQVLNYFGLGRR
ncbi:hypothetical protein ACFTQ7_24620 [Lysinibacillus sp. NPDC056959]